MLSINKNDWKVYAADKDVVIFTYKYKLPNDAAVFDFIQEIEWSGKIIRYNRRYYLVTKYYKDHEDDMFVILAKPKIQHRRKRSYTSND